MRDPRPPVDPSLKPLLERLAFLETANDGLKNRLAERSLRAGVENSALREQLERAKVELARQEEALANLCRETLTAAQARDRALAASEESIKAVEEAARERDEMRSRLRAALEAGADAANREAESRRRLADSLRTSDALELRLESALKEKAEAVERAAKLRSECEKARRDLRAVARQAETDRRARKKAEAKLEAERRARSDAPARGAAPFAQPAVQPLLDPGWARLLRLVRPAVDSAYAHLRRLSATALTAGQKTLLRMTAASIAEASDSLSSIQLSLEDGPAPGAASPLLPVLEASLAAWEAAFRGKGVALAREVSPPLPEAAHDPDELRIALHHVLRNVLEAVPRGGRLAVRACRGPDGGLRLEFADDGPGFPPEWLGRRFEPFAAPSRGRAGLGLSLVRRTLRRWGGDAEAANGPSGKGARLTLLFAPPAAPRQMTSPV